MDPALLTWLKDLGPLGLTAGAIWFIAKHIISELRALRDEESKRTELVMDMLKGQMATIDNITKQAQATAIIMQSVIGEARELVRDLADVQARKEAA